MTEQMEAAELPVEENDRDQRTAHDQPGERAADAAAAQAERGQTEMAEDQRPAEQSVERDAAELSHKTMRGRSSAETKLRSSWNSSHGAVHHM